MFGATVGVGQPEFYRQLGRSAEFVYGPSQWEPDFVTLRAGGLIPIARQYPGAQEFVEAHHRAYPGADLSYQTAAGYAGCQVLVEAVKRAGSLDQGKVRDAILTLDFNTVFGAFKVDPDGLQIAHKMVTVQWQDARESSSGPRSSPPASRAFPRRRGVSASEGARLGLHCHHRQRVVVRIRLDRRGGAATSIYRKGRKFIFGMLPPAETRLEGLIDLAARKGLKSVAVINVDDLARRAGAQGTIELARNKGLQVVFAEAYPLRTTDFSAILTRVRGGQPRCAGRLHALR